MPVNHIAVLIFTFIAVCVFVFCAANIVVQLKIYDLKRLLQDDYEKARQKLVSDLDESWIKYNDELAGLKIEVKALKNQIAKKDVADEYLSSAEILGKTKKPQDDPQHDQSLSNGILAQRH